MKCQRFKPSTHSTARTEDGDRENEGERWERTDTLRQGPVPVTHRLAGQHRRPKQAVAGIAVVRHHCSEGEVSELYFALPDGIAWNSRVRTVDH